MSLLTQVNIIWPLVRLCKAEQKVHTFKWILEDIIFPYQMLRVLSGVVTFDFVKSFFFSITLHEKMALRTVRNFANSI